MYKEYQPQGPFNVWFQLLKRDLKFVSGHNIETFVPDYKGKCSCINYSTNDTTANDLKTHQDQWSFEARYSNKIQAGDRIMLLDDNSVYDIVGEPENVRRENKYIKFKMVRVNGKKAKK